MKPMIVGESRLKIIFHSINLLNTARNLQVYTKIQWWLHVKLKSETKKMRTIWSLEALHLGGSLLTSLFTKEAVIFLRWSLSVPKKPSSFEESFKWSHSSTCRVIMCLSSVKTVRRELSVWNVSCQLYANLKSMWARESLSCDSWHSGKIHLSRRWSIRIAIVRDILVDKNRSRGKAVRILQNAELFYVRTGE